VLKVFFTRPALLVSALAVDALLVFLGLNWVGTPMGDLNYAYQGWANTGSAFGISVDWVYPYLAWLPIWLANLITPGNLLWGWIAIWALVQLSVLWLLTSFKVGGQKKERFVAGYFWLAATLLLGPVSISRLDAFSVGFAVSGVVLLFAGFARSSSVLITVGLWIKVWPIAIIAAVFASAKQKVKTLSYYASFSGVIVLFAVLLGANTALFSFLSDQGGRGIQIESPLATFWLWPAVMGDNAFGINYNGPLMTFEVFGPNTELFATLMTIVQLGALAITLALALVASKRGADQKSILFWASFTGVLDLTVFNKVGSPQYLTWLVVPVVIGILAKAQAWKTVAGLTLVVSFLTWLIYPFAYDAILASHFWETALLTLRNAVLLGSLVYANLELQKLGK
jgi:hypothetical protein